MQFDRVADLGCIVRRRRCCTPPFRWRLGAALERKRTHIVIVMIAIIIIIVARTASAHVESRAFGGARRAAWWSWQGRWQGWWQRLRISPMHAARLVGKRARPRVIFRRVHVSTEFDLYTTAQPTSRKSTGKNLSEHQGFYELLQPSSFSSPSSSSLQSSTRTAHGWRCSERIMSASVGESGGGGGGDSSCSSAVVSMWLS